MRLTPHGSEAAWPSAAQGRGDFAAQARVDQLPDFVVADEEPAARAGAAHTGRLN
jgi:hypothetical protein